LTTNYSPNVGHRAIPPFVLLLLIWSGVAGPVAVFAGLNDDR
jgi:hypothetical protein